jgi:hypothetical protein
MKCSFQRRQSSRRTVVSWWLFHDFPGSEPASEPPSAPMMSGDMTSRFALIHNYMSQQVHFMVNFQDLPVLSHRQHPKTVC